MFGAHALAALGTLVKVTAKPALSSVAFSTQAASLVWEGGSDTTGKSGLLLYFQEEKIASVNMSQKDVEPQNHFLILHVFHLVISAFHRSTNRKQPPPCPSS